MIDVSEYQGRIDWPRVYSSGVRRVYIKLGEGLNSWPGGNPMLDSEAVRNIQGARHAGLEVGLYYYAHPSTSPSAAARWLLRASQPYLRPGDLPPALDLEVTEGLTWAQLDSWKASWFAAVDSQIGCRAVFYSYYDFWTHMTLYPDRPVWGADLRTGFVPPSSWFLHQHSFTGQVPGIQGHVDLDRWLHEVPRVATV